jgi:hypothetical protein
LPPAATEQEPDASRDGLGGDDAVVMQLDVNCTGLEAARSDGGVRTLFAHACTAQSCWNLFANSNVNGGYLGKSVITSLIARYPNVSFRPYSKSALDYGSQREAFLRHCETPCHLEEVQDLIVQKAQALPSLQKTVRCINVPDRLTQAVAVATAASAAAAQEPLKATMDDNLYARVVCLIKYSEMDPNLGAIFKSYYNNDHSASRHNMDTDGFRSSNLLEKLCVIFNDDEGFRDYCDNCTIQTQVMRDVLSCLNPSALPAPGPIVPDQLIKCINWTRSITTKLVTKYDRSGHLDHGAERLRDMYDNFCGDIDRPKVACFMFAVLGIVFNKSNNPSWWNRMLPLATRCNIGCEDAAEGADESGGRTQQRQRRRYADMWDGLRDMMPNILQEPSAPVPAPPQNIVYMSADNCLRLLTALRDGERPQLRESVLDHVQSLLNAEMASPLVPALRAPVTAPPTSIAQRAPVTAPPPSIAQRAPADATHRRRDRSSSANDRASDSE